MSVGQYAGHKSGKGSRRRIDETTTPWTVADSSPNVSVNDFIVVTGPIVPVSRLLRVRFMQE